MPKKIFTGKVTKVIDDKTIKVQVDRFIKHKKYSKSVQSSRKFLVDTTTVKADIGNDVIIEESKPISKTKAFILKEVRK